MMTLQKVSFSYGKRPILQDISFSFTPGKFYALLGPNGCGKTTLIKLLSRQTMPGSGSLTLDGRDYRELHRREFAAQVALMPQGRNIPDTTVYELACCGRYPHLDFSRRLRETDLRIVEKALRATDTADLAQKRLRRLSGGERQRAYLAMLLAQETPWVLLDEPTTHLDIACAFRTMELLQQMRDSGKCVIAVLHDLDLALKYADEVLLLHRGGIAASGAPGEIVKSGHLERVFGVRCIPAGQDYLFAPLNPSSTPHAEPVMDFEQSVW